MNCIVQKLILVFVLIMFSLALHQNYELRSELSETVDSTASDAISYKDSIEMLTRSSDSLRYLLKTSQAEVHRFNYLYTPEEIAFWGSNIYNRKFWKIRYVDTVNIYGSDWDTLWILYNKKGQDWVNYIKTKE